MMTLGQRSASLRSYLPATMAGAGLLLFIAAPLATRAGAPEETSEETAAAVPCQVLDAAPPEMMLRFFRSAATKLSATHTGPGTLEAWQQRRQALRRRLWQSLGRFPIEHRPAVRARVTGRVDHGDHVVEKIVYESLPGLYVTALVYVPKRRTRDLVEPTGPSKTSGQQQRAASDSRETLQDVARNSRAPRRMPAVICVNGHWSEAKVTPKIQRRCIMLARMGVVAFCQDVIGTGERANFGGAEPTSYHGFYRGAAPRIVDRSLLGYIMYECLRANDYLRSRGDVDPLRILCTGASGGGKQSLYFPALDDRLLGGVPVCYVSSYVDHMGATACVGEIPTGVLRYTDQWEILGLHAPRPLLVMAARRDVPVFQPAAARRALRAARRRVYRLYGQEDRVAFAEFDSKHDYNRAMRERLYAYVAAQLLGQPGRRIEEPEMLPVESADVLRCGLPPRSETMQSLTFCRAKQLVAAHHRPPHRAAWAASRRRIVDRLEHEILGGLPERDHLRRTLVRRLAYRGDRVEHWTLETEPGVLVPAVLWLPKAASTDHRVPAIVVVDEQGKRSARDRGLLGRLAAAGYAVLAIDYRGTGETAGTVPTIGYGPGTPEYNLSNYALLLGRPLAGMRVHDVRCAIDLLAERPEVDATRLAIAGRGRGALVALLAAVLDDRIGAVAAENLLSSWVFEEEFLSIGLSTLIPRILTLGDIEHFSACLAPRPLLVLNPVDGRNRPLDAGRAAAWGTFARSVYDLHDAEDALKTAVVDAPHVPEAVAAWLAAPAEPLKKGPR